MTLDTFAARLAFPGLDPATPVVDHFRLEESVTEPYRAQLTIAAQGLGIDPRELLGADVVLTLSREPLERRFCGIAKSVRSGAINSDGSQTLIVELVPAFALLELRRNTRMFQQQTVPQILETVLGEALGPYGRSYVLDLAASYPTREYCLQYGESDLAFVTRLLEEEGIYLGFDHEGATEELVLRDTNEAAGPLDTVVPGELSYRPTDLQVRDLEPVHRFALARSHVSTALTVRDADWTLARHPVETVVEGADEQGRTRESYEHGEGRSLTIGDYDQGVRRYQANDAARQAQVRAEALAAPERVGHALGRAIDLSAGRRFRLTGHPEIGLDDEYLVTRVVHESDLADELRSEAGERYHNRFECIPLATPFRPLRRTSKPRIPSMQTAIVTGPAGEEIHTDEWGRVKVQFHWDRENPANETSSVWLRVRQAWAGAGWGALWVPRMGTEVVVSFVDGDPDRPVVTGSLYDASNPPELNLPDEKTKSTLKSNSTIGGGGFNQIRFEDAAGSEEVFIHSQKDMNRVTLNNETITVGVDQTVSIALNQDQTIGVDQTEDVGVDQTLTVGANRVIEVGGNFDETIGGTSTIEVNGHATETLNAGETQTVNAGRTETVNASETRTVNGSQTETINGALTQTVTGGITQTVTGTVTETYGSQVITTTQTYTHTIVGGAFVMTPSTYHLTALGGYALVCPPGGLVLAPGGWDIVAPSQQSRFTAVMLRLCETLFKIVGFKFRLTGLYMKAIGVKVGATGVSMSVDGVNINLKPLTAKDAAAKIEAKPATIRVTGFTMHVSGIHLFI